MVSVTSNRHDLKLQRREAREREFAAQREASHQHHRARRVKKYTVLGIGLVVLVSLLIFVISSTTGKPGLYDTFAKCLTEKSVVMYGAYWCPHCANQKKLFGSSFKYIAYVECDAGGKNPQPELCLQKGVESYPMWEINGVLQSGEIPLPVLAEKSGCPLNQ